MPDNVSIAQTDYPEIVMLASVLKPLEDIRGYQKIGKSLLKHFPSMRLIVLAYHPKGAALPDAPKRVQFVPLFGRGRLHPTRLGANFRLIHQARKKKVKCLIISTWELIPAALYLYFFGKVRVLYDVQENYRANLRHTQVYPWFLRRILAFKVSILERMLNYINCTFLLAEHCYLAEMPKMRPAILLENKCLKSLINQYQQKESPQNEPKNWVYSGTISAEYGIFDLLNCYEKLWSADFYFSLTIAGFAPIYSERKQIIEWAKDKNWVKLIGIEQPLAHTHILEAIHKADIVCMPYRVNPSYAKRIPTKFFECLALHKPMLISENPFWAKYLSTFEEVKAQFVDFKDTAHIQVLQEKINILYALDKSETRQAQGVFWEDQEVKLMSLFKT